MLSHTLPRSAPALFSHVIADNAPIYRAILDVFAASKRQFARASCMGLIREFDLDFVMTSEREWGCYAQIPGLSICQIVRREGMDAIFVSRWSWDGRERREEADPVRRFPEAVVASE